MPLSILYDQNITVIVLMQVWASENPRLFGDLSRVFNVHFGEILKILQQKNPQTAQVAGLCQEE